METPNPENIVVATRNFYLDPTHQRPIPSMLLAFVAEYAGFARVKTLRLQESKELVSKGDVSLQDVFAGASPDYAVVAQKHAPEDVLELTSAPFSADYGLSLEDLLSRWDGRFDRLESKAQQAESKAQQAETKAEQAETKAEQAETKAQQAETKAQQAEVSAGHWQVQANEWHERLLAVHASTSWKITKPLRAIKRLLSGDFAALGQSTAAVTLKAKKTFRPILAAGIRQVFYRPKLRARLSPTLKKFPWVHQRLLRLGINSGAVVTPLAQSALRPPQGLSEAVVGPCRGKKVAVLAPGSSLGTVGGAERFYSGLVKALREKGCKAELVCVTVDESSFERIQQGYKDFSELDLKDFDLVISTKAPTYAVKHTNHVLYLVHTVRVFYDMFDDVFPQADATLRAQRDWIHKEDSAAFSRIRHRFSIGTEVSRRLTQCNGCEAEVLHPPLDVEGLYDAGIGDYFYMPGRLHAWKRVDLAIRAIKHSSLPMRLVISGSVKPKQRCANWLVTIPALSFSAG